MRYHFARSRWPHPRLEHNLRNPIGHATAGKPCDTMGHNVPWYEFWSIPLRGNSLKTGLSKTNGGTCGFPGSEDHKIVTRRDSSKPFASAAPFATRPGELGMSPAPSNWNWQIFVKLVNVVDVHFVHERFHCTCGVMAGKPTEETHVPQERILHE